MWLYILFICHKLILVMKYFSCFLVFLLCNFSFGQNAQFPIGFSMKSDSYSASEYERSDLNIFYEFRFIHDSKFPQNFRESKCVLQIGKEFSKFSDINILKKDSLAESFSQMDQVGGKEINLLLKYKELWPLVSLKSKSDRKVIHQKRIRTNYEFEENQPILKWDLKNDSKKILGYNCKKALVSYRGRNFIAWYTSEIPINEGPYIFDGLPGLILEIEDSENKYMFIAVGIEKKPMDIYLRNDKSILKVTREKFREVQKNYHDNPGAFHGKAYNDDGSSVAPKSTTTIPYDPFELE